MVHLISHWYSDLYSYTHEEIMLFIVMSCTIYIEYIMNPTSAVGGVSAISLGEAQMTLGVASLNIKTPVMTCQLKMNSEEIECIVESYIGAVYLSPILKEVVHLQIPQRLIIYFLFINSCVSVVFSYFSYNILYIQIIQNYYATIAYAMQVHNHYVSNS